MKRDYHFKPHDINRLHSEILEAIPELKGDQGINGIKSSELIVHSKNDSIFLEFPDKYLSQIDILVNSHVKFESDTKLKEIRRDQLLILIENDTASLENIKELLRIDNGLTLKSGLQARIQNFLRI